MRCMRLTWSNAVDTFAKLIRYTKSRVGLHFFSSTVGRK